MNNKILFTIGAIILAIVLGGTAFIMSKNSSKAPVPAVPVVQTEKPASNQKSLKDLIISGQAQKCTFSDKLDNADISGTAYVANGKMRGDFNSAVAGKNIMMHMIVDGKTSYTWMDGQTTGYKMVFDSQKTATPTENQQSVDVNKVIDYNCSSWTIDSFVFTPPANVKFSETGTMMEPSGSPTGASMQDKCSVCDVLPGSAKAECRTALKCS